MADDTLKKVGDAAKKYVAGLKALPIGESETQGLKEAAKNVSTTPASSDGTSSAPVPVSEKDKVNPLARYGSRPGEKRLDAEGNEIPVHEHMDVDTGKPSSSLPPLSQYPKPTPLPSYQEGGTVPEDQIAKLHEGEEVLPREEADQYRAEHEQGAPADFSGRVFPNPKGYKPILDTEIPRTTDTDRLPNGVKADVSNAPLETTAGDTSNPPTAQVAKPGAMHEISAKTTEAPKAKPFGQLVEEKATEKADEAAAAQPKEAPMPEEKPKVTYGNLLADKWMQKNGITAPAGLNQGAPDQGAMEQGASAPKPTAPSQPAASGMPAMRFQDEKPVMPQYGGPGKPVAQGEAIPAKQLPQDELKYQLADLKQQHTAALAERTPAGQEKADHIEKQIQDLQKSNPWGSAANHPGFLGKLGHIGEMIASRTPVLAPIVATLPGSEGYRAAERAGTKADLEKDTALNTARAAEETKEAPKPVVKPNEAVYAAHIAAGETPDQALAASEVKPATGKEQVPENRLADANAAIANAQAALDKNPNDQAAKDALAKASVEQKAVTAAMNAKAGSGAKAPATSEDVADYKTRIATALSGMADGPDKEAALKTYGTAPAGVSKAELDKRYDEVTKMRSMTDAEKKTKIAQQQRDDAAAEHKLEHDAGVVKANVVKHDADYVKPAQSSQKSYEMMDHAYQEYLAAKAQGKDLPTGAQSMVALSTHLATTFGNVKGARITKDMIQEHLKARSISDSALVAFQRLTNGDKLSPEQWVAFHDLINTSRTENWKTAVVEAGRKKLPVDFLPDDLAAVKLPGHNPGVISASSLAAFQKKYPDATVVSVPK